MIVRLGRQSKIGMSFVVVSNSVTVRPWSPAGLGNKGLKVPEPPPNHPYVQLVSNRRQRPAPPNRSNLIRRVGWVGSGVATLSDKDAAGRHGYDEEENRHRRRHGRKLAAQCQWTSK
jgi:hypothetical protein